MSEASQTDSLAINEIFFSIQGESSRCGLPCLFIRLTGCNLRCKYCDTEYAFHEGRRLTLEEIMNEVHSREVRLVEITGGEPLMQPACLSLMKQIADLGRTVLLETGGSLDIGGVDPRIIRILDLKCPSSGESHRNHYPNLEQLRATDEVKFVVGDRADFDWAADLIRSRLSAFDGQLLFSPVHDQLAPGELARWLLDSGLEARLQVQLHKYLWPEETRGV